MRLLPGRASIPLLILLSGGVTACSHAASPVVMAAGGASALVSTGASGATNDRPRVAVFSQRAFPYYNVSPLVSPKAIAEDLDKAGVQADVLDAAALADPVRFSANRYAALVLPYGNTYPQEAFANMRAFHAAGGCLVLSGVPFTHPAARLSAADWSASPDWGENVHLAPEGHTGHNCLELKGKPRDWVGVSSPRQAVHPGDAVLVMGWVQNVQGEPGEDDWIFARFFDQGGSFISQKGTAITAGDRWHSVTTTVTAPATAASFDISPQVRTPGRIVRVDDLSASINARVVNVPNAGFETPGNAWSDLGHNSDPALFGPAGIGVGGFGAVLHVPVTLAPGDPLGLAAWKRDWGHDGNLQVLDTATLPARDSVIPILLEGQQPVAALIVHHDSQFNGAVDVWTHHPDLEGSEAYDTEQLLARGTIAALEQKGLLRPAQQRLAFAALDRLPKPVLLTNLTLPNPPRPYPTFQPKMPPPAQHLLVADAQHLDYDHKVLLISLQGIVNRKQPRIYLLLNGDDPFWLEQMQRQGETGQPVLVADPMSLVGRFRDEIRGAVVPDTKVYVSPCVAVDLAGLENLVIATPDLAKQLKLPIMEDLRGRFMDDADAYRYVRTQLLSRLNPYLSICLDPPIFDSGAIDQIIAAKGMAFWVTGVRAQDRPGADEAAEQAQIEATFAKLPLNAVVRGFWWHGDGIGLDEGPGVSLGSRFGKVTVVSDYVSNFSVLGGVPMPSLQQTWRKPGPRLDPTKVYVAITMSDGDNLCTWRGYFRGYFNDPLHGTFPVGWGMGPTLLDVAPTLAKWYYDHATPNDEFLCDVSGVGYIYPPDYARALKDRDGALKSFYNWTQQYMNRLDMKTVRLMNVRTEDIPQVGRDLPGVAFLMPDYGYSGENSYGELTYTLPTGQAVFRAATNGSGAQNLADQVRKRVGSTRPAFVNVFIWNWGSKLSDLKEMLDLLGPDYVAVTPSQLNTLYRESQGKG